MAEKVGLIAILDMSQFNRSFASYTRALGQMNSQTSQAAGGMGSAFIGLGDSVNALAGKIAVGLVTALAAATAATAAFVASGISEAANLEQQLDGVNAILGNTEQQSLAVKDAVFQLGLNPKLKVTAAEAANAIELLARNGLSTNEILGETGDIMDSAAFAAILLANATGSDFGLAADIATDAMAVFNLRAEDMVEVVNDIVGVTNNSKFTIQDYNLALRNGGAAAADMGVSLTDFNTVIAASAEELGSGMRAGTGFRAFITRLTPNTKDATEAMRELGLITADGSNVFFDSTGTLKDMSEVTKILNGTFSELTDIERSMAIETIFSADALGTVLALAKEGEPAFTNVADAMRELGVSQKEATRIVEEGITAYELLYDQIAGTDAVDQAKQRMDNFKGSLEILSGIFETVRLQIGDIFLPTLKDLTDGLIKIADDVGPRIIGFFSDFFQSLLAGEDPILALFRGLREAEIPGDVIGKIITFAEKVKDVVITVKDFGISIGKFVTEHADVFIGALQGIGSLLAAASIAARFIAIASAITALLNPVTALIAIAGAIGAAIKTDFAGAGTAFDNIVQSIQDGSFTWEQAWDEIVGVAENIWGIIKPHLEAFGSSLLKWFDNINWSQVATSLTLGIQNVFSKLGLDIKASMATLVTNMVAFENIGESFDRVIEAIRTGSLDWQMIWDEIVIVAQNVWSMIEPHLTALWTNITAWFTGIDWAAIGQTMLDSLLTAGGNLWAFLLPKLTELLTNIQNWFVTTDWAAIGQTLYDKLLGTSETIGEKLGASLAGILVAITEWINTVDWTLVGSQFITAIGNGIVAVLGLLWTYMNIFYEFISAFVQSADWAAIAWNLITAINTALGEFNLSVLTTLAGWHQTFVTWVGTVDWLAVGTSIVTFIINALSSFSLLVVTKLAEWSQAFFTWLAGVDWLQLGIDIVTFIIDGLVNFSVLVLTTLQEWQDAFVTWFEGIDWYQIGYDIADFIIEGLEFFYETIPETLADWAQEFIDWVIDTDWKQLGLDIVEFVIKGLLNFIEVVPTTLEGWWKGFTTWFEEKDWGELAQKVIDGIIKGLQNGVEAVKNAIGGLVEGFTDRWDSDTESHSPSQLFRRKALEITEGLVIGLQQGSVNVISEAAKIGMSLGNALVDSVRNSLEEGQTLIEGFLDTAGSLSSIGNVFSQVFKEREIKPLDDRLKGLNKAIDDMLKQDSGGVKLLEQFGVTDLDQFDAMGDIFAAGLFPPQAISEARAILEMTEERNRVSAELAEKEAKILELQKQQQDLQILEQQFKLLDLISEHGLDAQNILGGMELGLDASLPDLIQAMSNAMQQLIASAEGELGISSPSKVFENIAENVFAGFNRGTKQESQSTISAMTDFTRGLVSSVTNGISNITNNNQRNRSLQLEVNNSFASQPQITDRSEMELLLASFV